METVNREQGFANISQRAVVSYIKALSDFIFVPAGDPAGLAAGEMEESQAALHAFFTALYANVFEHPEAFGMPLRADLSISEDERNTKDRKQEVKRHLDRARGMLQGGLDFLLQAGIEGRLEGQVLRLEGYPAVMARTRAGKGFLAGMEKAGLVITVDGDVAQLRSVRFPQMMPALKALAAACARYADEKMGKFQFARCDFQALNQSLPQPLELYRMARGEHYRHVLALHEFFGSKKYATDCQVQGAHMWVVQYQGDRKIKASPLFQIEYDDRHARPLRMQIKCASTNRLAGLLPGQPQALQDDFFQRVFNCRGEKCGWCRNKKTLGPALVTHRGVSRTVCWFSDSEVHDISDQAVELIQQYEQMHAELGK